MRSGQDPLSRTLSEPGREPRTRPLPGAFFDRGAAAVARALLGTVIWERGPEGGKAARIVETEAYVGRDRASHAFRGPTARNRSMFGPPGRWFVYRIHQVYCANVTTGHGQAVLLRGAEPLTPGSPELAGPGRLARYFGFAPADDGSSVRTGRVRLRAGDGPEGRVLVGPRVGISVAKARPLRYSIQGAVGVSRPRPPEWGRARGLP